MIYTIGTKSVIFIEVTDKMHIFCENRQSLSESADPYLTFIILNNTTYHIFRKRRIYCSIMMCIFLSLSIDDEYSGTSPYPHVVFLVFIKTTGVMSRSFF